MLHVLGEILKDGAYWKWLCPGFNFYFFFTELNSDYCSDGPGAKILKHMRFMKCEKC